MAIWGLCCEEKSSSPGVEGGCPRQADDKGDKGQEIPFYLASVEGVCWVPEVGVPLSQASVSPSVYEARSFPRAIPAVISFSF